MLLKSWCSDPRKCDFCSMTILFGEEMVQQNQMRYHHYCWEKIRDINL